MFKLFCRHSNSVAPLIALIAGVLIEAAPALAQVSAAPHDELSEIIVTGIRASLAGALDAKRDANQVMDAISAEDIGKFPDKNLAEALQRVTGVQVTRLYGEGTNITVRGANPSLIRVEINGSSALSETVGATDRAVDFRDLPVEFVSRIEVVKSPTADMTEGGISTVRIITRQPFDSLEPFIAGSYQEVYSNLAKKTDPKAALIGSKLFFDDTVGALLSVEWERRHIYDDTANTTGWNRRTGTQAANGSTFDGTLDWYPQIPRYINNRRIMKRTAFNDTLEWRPFGDDFKVYWQNTFAKGTEEDGSQLLQLNDDGGLFDYADSTVGADHTLDHLVETSNGPTGKNPLDLTYRDILGGLTRTQYVSAFGSKWTHGTGQLMGAWITPAAKYTTMNTIPPPYSSVRPSRSSITPRVAARPTLACRVPMSPRVPASIDWIPCTNRAITIPMRDRPPSMSPSSPPRCPG